MASQVSFHALESAVSGAEVVTRPCFWFWEIHALTQTLGSGQGEIISSFIRFCRNKRGWNLVRRLIREISSWSRRWRSPRLFYKLSYKHWNTVLNSGLLLAPTAHIRLLVSYKTLQASHNPGLHEDTMPTFYSGLCVSWSQSCVQSELCRAVNWKDSFPVSAALKVKSYSFPAESVGWLAERSQASGGHLLCIQRMNNSIGRKVKGASFCT